MPCCSDRSMQGTTFTFARRREGPTRNCRRSLPMPVNFLPSGTDYLHFLPEIVMIVAGTLIMLLEPLLGENKKATFSSLTVVAFIAALIGAIAANTIPGTSFSNMLIIDGFGTFFRVLV